MTVTTVKDTKQRESALSATMSQRPNHRRIVAGENQMTKDALRKDKERMDEIAERLSSNEPIKEWAILYWMAVAIGHLLEWAVRK